MCVYLLIFFRNWLVVIGEHCSHKRVCHNYHRYEPHAEYRNAHRKHPRAQTTQRRAAARRDVGGDVPEHHHGNHNEHAAGNHQSCSATGIRARVLLLLLRRRRPDERHRLPHFVLCYQREGENEANQKYADERPGNGKRPQVEPVHKGDLNDQHDKLREHPHHADAVEQR